MGVIVAVIMGMILTLPISSAALGIILDLSGIAAGAATVGCATQMVGFAVASFRENRWSGLLAQGVGTSMLQVPNIVRHPLIWVRRRSPRRSWARSPPSCSASSPTPSAPAWAPPDSSARS